MDKDFIQLVERYVEGKLPEADQQALHRSLRESGERLDLFAGQTMVDRLLHASKAPPVSVEQVLAALPRHGDTAAEVLHAIRQKNMRRLTVAPAERRTLFFSQALALAAGLLLLAAAWWGIAPYMAPRIGQLEIQGEVALTRGSRTRAVKESTVILRQGDRITTYGNSRASLTGWNGDIRLELEADTETMIRSGKQGKRIHLVAGHMTAQVARQEPGKPALFSTPNSEIIVLGTRFKMSDDGTAATVEVMEGLVRVVRTADRRTLDVGADQFVKIGKAYAFIIHPLLSPLPSETAEGDEPGTLAYHRPNIEIPELDSGPAVTPNVPGHRPDAMGIPPVQLVPEPSRTDRRRIPYPPILITRVISGAGDQGSLDGIRNLLQEIKLRANVRFVAQEKRAGQLDMNPVNNPVVYWSGKDSIHLKTEDREKLRQLALHGGTLLFDAEGGEENFYDSVRQELALMFPDHPLQRLSEEHPIFHSYYDIEVPDRPETVRNGESTPVGRPWLEGITINCRTVAILSRWELAGGWANSDETGPSAYDSASARKLGVNLLSYIMAQGAWTRTTTQVADAGTESGFSGDKLFMAQLIYGGEWKTRDAGLSALLGSFNNKTDIPVKFGLKTLLATDPGIFDAPLLFITGHENFRFSEEEAIHLRKYLQGGGFLLAEACCGRRGFDAAFRREILRVLPDKEFRPVPKTSSLFHLPNRIDNLAVTPSLAAEIGRGAIEPRLWGIELGGHYAVIYSPYGLSGGWEMSPSPYAHAYDEAASILLGQNLLMYAVTQ